MTEILEKALMEYKGERGIKPTKKLSPYLLKHFECDKCGNEYYDEVAYSYAPSMNEINDCHTYCSGCMG